jgi:predicted phage terminase large subunit-like protein
MPGWHLGNHPTHEIISCSYAEGLALGFSKKCRDQLSSPLYKGIFSTRLDPKTKAAQNWMTTAGGGYLAAGVGGGITGKGANILIIDDPVKNREDAESQNNRDMNWDWYTSTAYTRLAPGGGILVIMTRWHDDDLAGRLLTMAESDMGDEWELVRYPAEAEEDEAFRKKGEALHPERYDLKALERIRKAIGPRDWEALFQQNPVASDGDFFTTPMIKYYSAESIDLDALTYYQAWDLAIGKTERNDYTVGITVGVDEEDNIFIVDMVRGRLDGLEIVEAILDQYETWRPSVVGVEKGHINMALGPLLEKRKAERDLYECNIKELVAGRRDKELRARAIQGRMQQGKVLFPYEESFTKDIVSELLRFPNGVNDDIVDAIAWIGLMMTQFAAFYIAPPPQKSSWRDNLTKFTSKQSRRRTSMSA